MIAVIDERIRKERNPIRVCARPWREPSVPKSSSEQSYRSAHVVHASAMGVDLAAHALFGGTFEKRSNLPGLLQECSTSREVAQRVSY